MGRLSVNASEPSRAEEWGTSSRRKSSSTRAFGNKTVFQTTRVKWSSRVLFSPVLVVGVNPEVTLAVEVRQSPHVLADCILVSSGS